MLRSAHVTALCHCPLAGKAHVACNYWAMQASSLSATHLADPALQSASTIIIGVVGRPSTAWFRMAGCKRHDLGVSGAHALRQAVADRRAAGASPLQLLDIEAVDWTAAASAALRDTLQDMHGDCTVRCRPSVRRSHARS